MSSFGKGPQSDVGPAHDGPVLMVPPQPGKPGKLAVWGGRIFLVVFVLLCLEVGIALTIAPWTLFWTENSLLAGFPQVREFLMYDFVRGLISGLGLVNIWMAVAEAVRYRES